MARGSSPALVGRGVELARLRDAVRAARDADRCVVLISGEAGIGKSRLIAELVRSLEADSPTGRPVAVLGSECIDVGASLAYLPIIELLDSARGLGPEIEAQARHLRLALGGVDADPREDLVSAPTGRAATFLRIREVLAGIAADRDVVAVIDDLQWADRSTLDVVAFLSRRLVGSGALLVLAYRSDELNRRHPLRPVLADIQRRGALEHLRLEPLGAADVRRQVAAILGGEPDPDKLERVVRLADGNPFHVEELLSLGGDRRLPSSLRDVLDARLDQLDDASHRVVREAAVIGRQVDTLLLTAISSIPPAEVMNGLRLAVEARILVADDDRHHRFRHELLREAVYDDLPPAERIETHRRIARALTDRPELGDRSPTVALADLARHWLAGRADGEAFAALLAAARSAVASMAWAEARAAFEEALGLWEKVEDPRSVAGARRSEILERAAEISWLEGDARRAVSLNRRAQAEPDVLADPTRLGRLAHREARLLDDLGDLAGEGEAAARARRLIPEEPPSPERVLAVSGVALHALRTGRVQDAADDFERAVDLARALGMDNELAANLSFLAMALAEIGVVDRPRQVVTELDKMLPRITDQVAWSVVTTWTPWVWIGMAEYQRAIEYADRLLVEARARGLDRGVGLWCLAPRALAQFWLGRWEDATASIARQGEYTWGIDAAVYLRSVAALIAAGRGDVARARSEAADAIDIARSGFPEQAVVARFAAAWVELLDGRPEVALDHVRAAWTVAAAWQGLGVRSLVLWIGSWTAADLAAQRRSRDDRLGRAAAELASEMARALGPAGDRLVSAPAPSAAARLVLELARAELARVSRRDDARAWGSIGEALEAIGDLPRAALCRQREAEAMLRDGAGRAEATRALKAALGHAEAMGAARLRDRALGLARAARLKLEPEAPPAPRPGAEGAGRWGLSAREREVLAMLVDGLTNREIAAALFISDKTASVHVTHIMDKLGVSRRTEAAMLAIRSGIGTGSEGAVPGAIPALDSPPF